MQKLTQAWNKTTSSMKIGGLLVAVVLTAAIAGVATLAVFIYQDSKISVRDVTLTNVTDTGITVTWVSDDKYSGKVFYQESDKGWGSIFAQSGKDVAYDDRDVELNEEGEYVEVEAGAKGRYTHHVSLRNLKPETEYSFRVGGKINGKAISAKAKTTKLLEDLKTPDPGYGKVIGVDPQDSVIIARLKTGTGVVLSQPISKEGTYSIDMNLFGTGITGSALKMTILSQAEAKKEINMTADSYKPYPNITFDETDQGSLPLNNTFIAAVNAETDCFNYPSFVLPTEGSSGINVRKTPSINSTILYKLNSGQAAPVVACETPGDGYAWYQVNLGTPTHSKIGYVRSDVVGTIDEATTAMDLERSEAADAFTTRCEEFKSDVRNATVYNIVSGQTANQTCAGTSAIVQVQAAIIEASLNKVCCVAPIITTVDYNDQCESSDTSLQLKVESGYEPSIYTDPKSFCVSRGYARGNYLNPENNKVCCFANAPTGTSSYTDECTAAGTFAGVTTSLVDFNAGITNDDNCKAGGASGRALLSPNISTSGNQICCANSASAATTSKPTSTPTPTPKELADAEVAACSAKSTDTRPTANVSYDSSKPLQENCNQIEGAATTFEESRTTDKTYYTPYGSPKAGILCCRASEKRVAVGINKDTCETTFGGKFIAYDAIKGRERSCTESTDAGPGYRPAGLENGNNICCVKGASSTEPVASAAETDYVNRCTALNSTERPTEVVLYADSRNKDVVCAENGGAPALYPIQMSASTTASLGTKKVCCKKNIASTSMTNNPKLLAKALSYQVRAETPMQGSVLGAANTNSLEATESGRYAFFESGEKIVEEDIIVEGESLQVKLFIDNNGNGKKDEDEIFYQDYSKISLAKEATATEYNLNSGWNLINLPLVDTRADNPVKTANDLINYWNKQGTDIVHVARFRDGKFELFSKRSGSEYAPNFNINTPGQALFVMNNGLQKTVSFSGNKFEQSVPLTLNQGWNLVGVVAPGKTYNSEQLLKKMETDGIKASTMSQFENGLYRSVINENNTIFGNNFNVIDKRGYFIKVEEGGGEKFTP